jgi:hypothetical protein
LPSSCIKRAIGPEGSRSTTHPLATVSIYRFALSFRETINRNYPIPGKLKPGGRPIPPMNFVVSSPSACLALSSA